MVIMGINRIIVSAGGSGGHIVPALNISCELRERGVEVHYIGNKDSMEETLVKKNGFPFYPIDVQKIYRSFTIKHVKFPFKLIKSINQCKKYFREINPDAFIGFGGFVSGPPAWVARMCQIPVYIQEQNCRPGITNVMTGKFAQTIYIAHEDSKTYFKGRRTVLTGNPVKVPDTNDNREKPTFENFRPDSRKLLVLGGSQGSLAINNLILEHLDWFFEQRIDIIWQAGQSHIKNISEKIQDRRGIFAFDFSDKLSEYYQIADFAIARGGALTLAELDIYKLPAFIIPLVGSGVNEQYYNAKNFEKQKKCVVFEKKDLTIFTEKFILFTENLDSMYTEKSDTIHIKAIKIIVDDLLGGINV
jgi:UDP-N-acetylglucosamine--N-acetylmuramyl-(pentapeptide) pyrophosphoryl-undecaprenol N-acetylglucosamine transferase